MAPIGTAILTLAAATALAAPGAAGAQAPQPVEVRASGNILIGPLAFTPSTVTVPLGGRVRWRNTDFVAPHTATEDHGLWELTGSWGQTPLNPPGFAPRATVERAFEAGTHHYLCRVHPTQMHGTVSVPVSLRVERTYVVVKQKKAKKRKKGKRRRPKRSRFRLVRYVAGTWAVAAPASGLVYDAEWRIAGGAWTPLLTGTREPTGRFSVPRRGGTFEVHARLRRNGSQAATDWSPVASKTLRRLKPPR